MLCNTWNRKLYFRPDIEKDIKIYDFPWWKLKIYGSQLRKKKKKKSSFFIRGENCTSCTHTTLLLNALSFWIVREMMLGCRHLLLQLIKKLFPFFPFIQTFCVYKSEKKLVRRTGSKVDFSVFEFSRQNINTTACTCDLKFCSTF